ncbi:MAG: cobyric acid synthase [Hyphomicrobiales bacterium]|nr:cobyric acid synthase [Hyphomicrobiales bacterium]
MTPALMIQGTGSDVGKSLLVAGLARAFTRRGFKVRPFKPQNMSNNAAVTVDGGEIGRAQALHARACGVAPSVHMNPVLLKPETDTGAQVIVRGRREATLSAREWMRERVAFLPKVIESFEHLGSEADLVLVEGAGSPAEINLREGDIANMGFALVAQVPVVLVGDIHRGGVIASIVGSLEVISAADAAQIRAFLINKFHGDVSLFADGMRYLEERTHRPCAGVIPHFPAAHALPAEDALALDGFAKASDARVKIAVPRLSRIANFDDLDPLRMSPGVTIDLVEPGRPLPRDAALVLLPGSKSTIGDMKVMIEQGWDIDIRAHVRHGGRVLGLCGGYQMLGARIHDPDGVEGPAESVDGLGLLDVETILTGDKALTSIEAVHTASAEAVSGYEMHLGRTEGADCKRPFVEISGRGGGAVSMDGLVEGTYLHGIFAADAFRQAYLDALGAHGAQGFAYEATVERALDDLAQHLEAHADLDLLLDIARGRSEVPLKRNVSGR